MSNTNNSANMSLPIPVVGTQSGPQYAININDCLTIIDGHDHTPGSGVQIVSSALNINGDVAFNSNTLTLVESVRFDSQSAVLSGASDLGCLYEVSDDLYYNDGNGVAIRVTQNGALAGTPGSIANLVSPASASYVSGTGTFVFQSGTNTAAFLDASSILIRNSTANSYALTLAAPAAMGANYTVTLPSLPLAKKFVTMNTAGDLAADTVEDNTTLEVSSGTLRVKALGVDTAQLANGSVTPAKKAALGQQISSSCGAYATNSSSFVDITGLSVTITTTGRPVIVALVSDGTDGSGVGTGQPGIMYFSSFPAGTTAEAQIKVLRDSTPVAYYNHLAIGQNSSMASGVQVFDTPAAGTYTYKAQAKITSGPATIEIHCVKLVAYEL